MRTLAASEVAKLLHEFGQRISFRGGNPYRARAYMRAAENLLTLAEPLEDIVAQNRLREIPGVGNGIAESGFLKSLLRISLCYANPCIRLSEAPYA